MVTITPLISSSNTQESTSSTSPQNTDVVIDGADLVNGRKYMVMYCCSYGGADFTDEIEVQIEHGSTIIAKSAERGDSTGTPESSRTKSLNGFYIITGDATSALRIKIRCATTGATCYIGGKTLIAIPLHQLTEGSEYWQSTQNGDAAEVSNAATDFSTNLITLTSTLPAADFLVLMSAEISPGSVLTAAPSKCRFVVDGVNQKLDYQTKGKMQTIEFGWISYSYAQIKTLGFGSRIFKIDIASETGTRTDGRRGRIILLKKSVFDQMISLASTTETTSTSTTYVDFLSQSYTPNQQEHVVIIGNTALWAANTSRSAMIRLRNDTDGTNFSDQTSVFSSSADDDRHAITAFGCEQISTAKTYKLQFKGESPSPSSHVDETDLIMWGLTKAPVVLQPVLGDDRGTFVQIGPSGLEI